MLYILITLRDILMCRMKGFTHRLILSILSDTLITFVWLIKFDRGISKVRVLQWNRVKGEPCLPMIVQ
jgi:hypothetical protein